MAAVGKPECHSEGEGEVDPGERSGQAGADYAKPFPGKVEVQDARAQVPMMAVDKEPVEEKVDDVRGDECRGDGADVVEGLEVASEREVEEQGKDAGGEGVEGADGPADHVRIG